MPTAIDTAALQSSFDSYFDQVEGWVVNRLVSAELPMLGAALLDHQATLTAFVDVYRAQVTAAIDLMDPAVDTVADVAAILEGVGIGTVVTGDVIDLRLTYSGAEVLSGMMLAADLGLSVPGFGLGGVFDLAAGIESELLFRLDTASGALTREEHSTDALNLTLSADVALDAAGSLGILDVAVTETDLPPDFSGASNIELTVNMTAWSGGGAKLTAEGAFGIAAQLETTTDAAILPTLGAEFGATFEVASQTLEAGVGLDVDARFWLDDVTLDLGGFSQFLGAVFGELDRLLDTFPLGKLIDIVTTELPVLPDILPGLEDRNDNDDVITILDLLNKIGANVNTEFLDEVIYLVRLIQAVDGLADAGVLNLGGVDLSASASTVLTGGGSLDGGDLLDPTVRAGEPEPQAWLDFLAVLGDGNGLDLPFLQDPLNNLVNLLLNGLGAPTVELVEYNLPEFQFTKGIDLPFYFGPIKFFIGGEFGTTIDMGIGYDTAGLSADGLDFSQGFYLGSPINGTGAAEAIATLALTLEAGGGVDALLASVTVAGGITGTLGLNLVGSDDGKTYLAELASFPCIFDDISGKVTAGLNIEFTLGKKPLAVTERLNIAEVVLAQFNLDPCDVQNEQMRMLATGMARDVDGSTLRLHVGADARLRTFDAAMDNNQGEVNPDTVALPSTKDNAGLEEADEVIVVDRAPTDDGEGLRYQGEALAVYGFGVYDVVEAAGWFNTVEADGGAGNDYLALAGRLTLDAEFTGGDGADTLIGAQGDDLLQGNDGRDQLYGDAGDDTLQGGRGADVLNGGWGADVLNGGDGLDEVDYSDATSGVILTPQVSGTTFIEFLASSVGLEANEADGDVLRSIEYLRGSEFDDQFFGNPFEQNILQGKGGNDLLSGGAADDLLVGGEGADTLIGGSGSDTASYALSAAAVWIDLSLGIVGGGEATGDVLTDIESFDLTYHDDYFHGDAQNNVVEAMAGDDLLIGGGGDDVLRGGSGQDTVHGDGSGDVLSGGGAIFQGVYASSTETDRDLLTYQDATHASGIDADLLAGTATRIGTIEFDVISHATLYDADLNEIAQSDFSSFENLTGSGFDDILGGDEGDNILRGRNGDDVLNGRSGSDTLIGGNGADTINGGVGNDWVDYSASGEGVTVDLGGGIGIGGTAEGDSIATVENVIGSDFSDSLSGNAVANVIDPGLTGAQGDTVDGGGAIDTLRLNWMDETLGVTLSLLNGNVTGHIGAPDGFVELTGTSIEQFDIVLGSGNDLIEGMSDNVDFTPYDDYASTGDGSDTIRLGSGRDIVLAGAGDDFVTRASSGAAETFYLDGGADDDELNIDLSHLTQSVLIEGSLTGEGPMDTLYLEGGGVVRNFEYIGEVATGAGDDTIRQLGRGDNAFDTGGGADLIEVESGDNHIDGGSSTYATNGLIRAHSDRLIVDASRLDGRIESVFFPTPQQGYDGSIAFFETLLGLETQTGTTDYTGIEQLFLTGGSKDDLLIGMTLGLTVGGALPEETGDRLVGGAGDDTLSGLGESDTLIGGEGADDLDGGTGNDTLVGGSAGIADGIDTVTGGSGSDLFVLGARDASHYGVYASDYAIITDFSINDDALQLHGRASDYTLRYTVAGDTLIDSVATGHRVATLQGVLSDLSTADVRFMGYATPAAAAVGGATALSGPIVIPGPVGPDPLVVDTLSLDPFQAMTFPMFQVLFGGDTTLTNEVLLNAGAGSMGMIDSEPFGMGDASNNMGFGLSTGDILDVAGTNLEDGADTPEPMDGLPQDLDFVKIGVTAEGSAVFRALLPASMGLMNSLTISDSNNLAGAGGVYSGFDLDAVMLSRTRVDSVDIGTDFDPSAITGALDVFDFSPLGTMLDPGAQSGRINPIFIPSAENLAGTIHGVVDEGFARLGEIDFDGNALNGGAFSLGDGGSVTFELTESVDTTTPLYLYVAEAADNGEEPDASIRASSGTAMGDGDLSEDRGFTGAQDDFKRLGYRFEVDFDDALGGAVWTDLFQLVIVTEELPENRQSADLDAFDIRINGVAGAVLSDGRTATMDNLMLDQSGALSEDVVINLAGTGALADHIKADAYTRILTVSGPVIDGENFFEFSVSDGGDGMLDTAIFLVPVTGEYWEGTQSAEFHTGTGLKDRLVGLGGEDTLNGEGGDDTLIGSGGDDLLNGGIGADMLDGGAGIDTASYAATTLRFGVSSVVASLMDPTQNTGDAAGDTYISIENLIGMVGDDWLEGDDGANVLSGTAGGDTLIGHGGSDTLLGGDGDDSIDGGAIGDEIDAGAGNDTVIGGIGRDHVLLGDGADLFADDAQVIFGEDTVFGGGGADTILGQGGDDSFLGEGGYDSIEGGDGNDYIDGGAGYDTIDAGAGNDTVFGGDGRDEVLLRGGDDLFTDNAQTGYGGADFVRGFGGADTMIGGGGNDTLRGEWGTDSINGGVGDDWIDGGDQNDTLYGDTGNDTVIGGKGSDEAYLGAGNDVWEDNMQALGDTVDGGEGNDTLNTGAGNDVLTGGADRDAFVLKAGMGFDIITDFELGVDVLVIDAALWGGPLTQQYLDSLDSPERLVSLDFGNGDHIQLNGLSGTTGLLSDIVLI